MHMHNLQYRFRNYSWDENLRNWPEKKKNFVFYLADREDLQWGQFTRFRGLTYGGEDDINVGLMSRLRNKV